MRSRGFREGGDSRKKNWKAKKGPDLSEPLMNIAYKFGIHQAGVGDTLKLSMVMTFGKSLYLEAEERKHSGHWPVF